MLLKIIDFKFSWLILSAFQSWDIHSDAPLEQGERRLSFRRCFKLRFVTRKPLLCRQILTSILTCMRGDNSNQLLPSCCWYTCIVFQLSHDSKLPRKPSFIFDHFHIYAFAHDFSTVPFNKNKKFLSRSTHQVICKIHGSRRRSSVGCKVATIANFLIIYSYRDLT